MSGSKNSIKELMAKKKPILQDTVTPTPAAPSKPTKTRKPKAEGDKTSARVQVFMTETEKSNLETKAGDVPLSKYLRKELIKAGII